MTHRSAPTGRDTRASSHGLSCSHAYRSMPTCRRLPPLPRRTRTPPRARSRSLSASASASLMRRPARQSTTISARVRSPCAVPPATRMTAMISSTAGGSVGYRRPLLRGARPQCKPGIVAGERRRPAASSKTELIMEARVGEPHPRAASIFEQSVAAGPRPTRQPRDRARPGRQGAPFVAKRPSGLELPLVVCCESRGAFAARLSPRADCEHESGGAAPRIRTGGWAHRRGVGGREQLAFARMRRDARMPQRPQGLPQRARRPKGPCGLRV
jgi:hypothetical protein